MRAGLVSLVTAALLWMSQAQVPKRSGPRPPKADIPYLLHGDNLVETEVGEAREEQRKEATAYVLSGAASPARTPLAEPIFVMQSEKIPPEKLSLFRLQVKGGNREIVFPQKKKDQAPRPLRFLVSR